VARAARASAEWKALTPEQRREVARKRRETEGAENINKRAREAHSKRMRDPAYREKKRKKSIDWIEANREKWKTMQRDSKRRKRLAIYAREFGDIATKIMEKSDE
jgi:hypothetical protein